MAAVVIFVMLLIASIPLLLIVAIAGAPVILGLLLAGAAFAVVFAVANVVLGIGALGLRQYEKSKSRMPGAAR